MVFSQCKKPLDIVLKIEYIPLVIREVHLSKQVKKDLTKVPQFILDKFEAWVEAIKEIGLKETRKIKGYHDEPLKGKRLGQRSVRLNKAYRAIYCVEHGIIKFIEVLEVNKHEY